MTDLRDIWAYLSQEPLLWLTATLVAYVIGDAIFNYAGKRPYFNPVLIAVVLLAGLLWAAETSYATYFEGAKFVHFMLGLADDRCPICRINDCYTFSVSNSLYFRNKG